MKLQFYIDPDTSEPHIFKHSLSEVELFDFFFNSLYFEYRRRNSSFEAFGKIPNGRFIQVAYRKKEDEIFRITAYDIEDKEMMHFIQDHL